MADLADDEETVIVQVPDADEMDDQTFLKHLDKRHQQDTGVEPALHKSVHAREAWVGLYRTFHEYVHHHNDGYDHEHVWDDDDSDG